MKCHRIFIEDLPENITESEIQSTFSKFGTVNSIDIKQRKNVTFRNSSCFFAYVNIETDENRLQNCFQHFRETKWNGLYVKIQIAKESFLERLKRERESNQENIVRPASDQSTRDASLRKSLNNLKLQNGDESNNTVNVEPKIKLELNGTPKRKKKLSTSSSESEEDSSNKCDAKPVTEVIEPLEIIIKNNKASKIINKKLKIESVGKDPILKIDLAQNKPRSLDKFRTQADHKRIDSLLERKKAYSQQKNAIQAALSYSNINKTNKIIFDDNDDAVPEENTNGANFSKESVSKTDNSRKKSLFDDMDSNSDEDHSKIFEIKDKFQGKAGEKLLKLQSTFKNDKRFVLDEKFLENEEEKYDETYKKNDEENINLEEEKKMEYEILGEILGQEVKSKDKFNKQHRAENETKVMRRFDPSQPDHIKYEMKKEDKKPKSKKRKEAPVNDKRVEDKDEPEVSQEIFYAVKDDLKQTLEEDKGFSLLSMFGTSEEKEEPSVEDVAIPIGKNHYGQDENPFKYDSSDDEDQTEQLPQEREASSSKTTTTSIKAWSEPFFFQEDDYRLQEGMDFIERIAMKDQGDFAEVRRNLKEITRYKVRSNLRKNRPFKTKLGGNRKKKLRRINKALKR